MTLRDSRFPVAALLVAALITAAAAPALAQGAATDKIAVIDVNKIIRDSQTGKAALADLERYGQGEEARLKAQKDEIDALVTRIQEGQLTLAQARLDELKSELEAKQIALKRANDDATREFNRRQARALQQIEESVMPIIQQVGQEQGYMMIFRKFDSGLVFAADQIDITAELIRRLDAQSAAGASPGG